MKIRSRDRRVMKHWKEKDELVLLNAVESRPTLWRLTDPLYRRTDIKEQLWDEIASEIDNPLVDGLEARRKWSVLRDSFSKVQRKVERSKSNDLGPNFVYRPKWKWYQSMTFLLNNPQPKSESYTDAHENEFVMLQIGNNDESQSDEERDDPLSVSDDNSLIDLWERPSTSTNASAGQEGAAPNDSSSFYTRKKGAKRKLVSESQDMTKENSPMTTKLLALLAKQNRPPPNDRAEHVGQLVAIQLRTMSEEEQSKKILEIMELMYKKSCPRHGPTSRGATTPCGKSPSILPDSNSRIDGTPLPDPLGSPQRLPTPENREASNDDSSLALLVAPETRGRRRLRGGSSVPGKDCDLANTDHQYSKTEDSNFLVVDTSSIYYWNPNSPS